MARVTDPEAAFFSQAALRSMFTLVLSPSYAMMPSQAIPLWAPEVRSQLSLALLCPGGKGYVGKRQVLSLTKCQYQVSPSSQSPCSSWRGLLCPDTTLS